MFLFPFLNPHFYPCAQSDPEIQFGRNYGIQMHPGTQKVHDRSDLDIKINTDILHPKHYIHYTFGTLFYLNVKAVRQMPGHFNN